MARGSSGFGRRAPSFGRRFAVESRPAVARGLLTAIIFVVASALACGSAQASGGTVTRTFSEEHSEHSFVVPAGVESINAVAIGGRGGVEGEFDQPGGFGGRVEGKLSVTPGQTLYVEVGYEGEVLTYLDGGGSSDVRTAPRADGLSPDDRLIVAGAGGGAGETFIEGEAGAGGNAGDEEGEAGKEGMPGGVEGGEGGTLVAGGFGGVAPTPRCEQKAIEAEEGERETGGEGGR